MDFLPQSFQALNQFPQFITFILVPSKTRPGKTDKFPTDYRTGAMANAHDSQIWTTAEIALAAAKQHGQGIGFVFTENDPFWFLDIDDCLMPCNTLWSPTANNLMATFHGALVEVSSSNRGLHIIGSGPAPTHSCRNATYGLEFYTSGRFVALTGTHASGNACLTFQDEIKWLVDNYFSGASSTPLKNDWTSEPCSTWNGPTDDSELIRRALQSQSAKATFGGGIQFRDLWDADIDVLSKAFPDPDRDVGYNESSADSALAQRLAFWTGNDCERIRGLMLQSKLKRDKWERDDYLPRTILGVCGRQTEWLIDKQPEPILTVPKSQNNGPRQTLAIGNTFLTPEQQQEHFSGCVHIAENNHILIPGGHTFNRETFNACYSGFTMAMDGSNEKTTDEPWKAFINSKILRAPKVDISCFRPDLEASLIITKPDGERAVNIYWPVNIPRQVGDITPILNHIAILCPDPQDQLILICYLAAIVQYPGVKFQWCPLIQGVEGNGKTILSQCVAYAVGDRYSHYPKSAEMSGKFNDWLYGKIFIGVEDVFVPASKLEFMEAIKPMITNSRQEIEPKGGKKITRDICANFLLNTNHKDGLRKTRNDRRFAPFYTAQQCEADLIKDGLTRQYFYSLVKWLKEGGFAIVAEFLNTYRIDDEFNPAVYCTRAPRTSSTEAAIVQSRGMIEQEILESVEAGISGFKGGWISSLALALLLDRLKASNRVPHNKRRELLKTIGYIPHPGLTDGRVNNLVMPDNGKPRLYIDERHAARELVGPGIIAKAYTDAQK